MSEEVRVVSMKPEHAVDVARLHIEGIHMGFLSSLGIDFVTALYKAIAKSKNSFGYVALKEEKVVGFASFTTDLNRLYKSVVYESGLKFFVLLFRRMFSLAMIRKVFETLFYPSRIKKINLPKAEFLSMAISPDARGHGLATRFVKTGFEECRRRGVKELKILAAEKIIPINKMYEKFGFQVTTKIENHGVVSNVYVVPTDYFKETPSH
jgi:GNAT superfamily N-acetyltransferase